jgi:predicted secreted Zn-dependent protease
MVLASCILANNCVQRSLSRIASILFVLILYGAQVANAADAPRRYSDGPIVPADFKAAVPDPSPVKDGIKLRAMTHTEIRYTTRYRWDEAKSGVVTAWLTRFDCYAVLLCDKSWIKEPMDLRLIDHEQGHFDITEINARRAQKKFVPLIADKSLIGHGHDEASAVADLHEQVHDQMQHVFDSERDEQIEYDRVTNHGRNHSAQAEQRQIQHDRIKELDPKQPERIGK